MKKYIFILLTTFLIILILLYFYDRRETVLNKKYLIKDSIYIEYPYFHNNTIDSYITSYLKEYKENSFEKLFIDYDYLEENDKIKLTMYIHSLKNNIIKNKKKSFQIDLINSTIFINKNDFNENIYNNINYKDKQSSDKKIVALTFDDGPNFNTNKVLSILEKYNVKATFFILGCNIKGHEQTIKRMHNLNMEIGNHMYSHNLLSKLNDQEITKEIDMVDKLLYNITNKLPILIRPSYGSINNKRKKIINRPIIIWNNDSLDWKYHNSKKIYNRVIKNIQDGDIILMHDIYRATANSLELIIPELIKKNYQIVTVSELLYYKNIKVLPNKIYNSGK